MDACWVLYRRAPPELVMSCGIFVSVGKPGNASPSLTLLYYPLCWQCSSRFVRSSHFQVPMWLLLAFPNFSKMIFTSHMFFALDSPTLAWSTDVPQTAWDTRSHHERFVSVTIIRVQLLEVLPTGVLRCTIACERPVSTLSTHKEDQRGIKENHYKRKTAYFETWLEHLSFGISFTFRRANLPASPLKGHKFSQWMRMILQGVALGTVPGLVACGQQRGASILAGFLSDASGFRLLRAWFSFVD